MYVDITLIATRNSTLLPNQYQSGGAICILVHVNTQFLRFLRHLGTVIYFIEILITGFSLSHY